MFWQLVMKLLMLQDLEFSLDATQNYPILATVSVRPTDAHQLELVDLIKLLHHLHLHPHLQILPHGRNLLK